MRAWLATETDPLAKHIGISNLLCDYEAEGRMSERMGEFCVCVCNILIYLRIYTCRIVILGSEEEGKKIKKLWESHVMVSG